MRIILIRLWFVSAPAVFALVSPCLEARGQGPAHAAIANTAKVDFDRDVRPILSDKCFACHGPDAKNRKGGLRLDEKQGALVELKSGERAIVPGNLEDSALATRIEEEDPTLRMPPPKSGKSLTSKQIDILKRWIEQGGEYHAHWSFTTPVRPEAPRVQDDRGVQNAIDRFIRARLDREGLKPAPEADRATLIRRLSLDLNGLPPTLEEIDAFERDKSPDAYEKLVDRLLASPRFGERLALWWLDGARYADSNGYQADYERYMWRWRDWVIDAFNKNMPFDRFTVEQLAGDLLPNPTLDQRIATGFNRNHRINTEGGIIAEEWRVETVIDRVETTSLVWLGLTMGCARCHDHKYDPIKQTDFYKFYSFFNNVRETGSGEERPVNHPPIVRAPRPWEQERLAKLREAVAIAERAVDSQKTFLSEYIANWEARTLPRLLELRRAWPLLDPTAMSSREGATLAKLDDGSILVSGKDPSKDVYTLTYQRADSPITALRLEIIPHTTLPHGSFGRHPDGNFVLSGFEAEVAAPGRPSPKPLKFVKAEADYSQKDWPISASLESKPGRGWAADGQIADKRVDRQALFVPEAPIVLTEGETLTVRLRFETLDRHTLGRFRITAATKPDPKLPEPLVPDAVVQAVFADPYKRDPSRKELLARYVEEHDAGPLSQARQALDKARNDFRAFEDAIPTVMVMAELEKPREAHVLIRGLYDHPGEIVTAGVPAALPPLPKGQPANRLGLARWIVDPSNPLTARVQVNRFWELLFGTGIVKTSENFGLQGESPSHPELLDWLATEFVQRGWDVKAIFKTIVSSATYRQSSRISPEMLERDPDNRLLARGPRFRLQAELIRDQALALSGLLVEEIGGPSVRPYQPDGIWDELSVYGNLRNYKHDQGPNLYRRGLYTIWKRTAGPPQMLIFDAPSRELCAIRRPRTNTPLQALVSLNDVTILEAARVLAERMIKLGGATPVDRIAYGFRRATGRKPDDTELQFMRAVFETRLERYRRDVDSAKKLIAQGDSKPDPTLDPAELAAYSTTAQVFLNLDETINKD